MVLFKDLIFFRVCTPIAEIGAVLNSFSAVGDCAKSALYRGIKVKRDSKEVYSVNYAT